MDKKEESTKVKNKANSTSYIMIAIIVVLVLVIGCLVLIKGCNNSSKNNDDKTNNTENNEIVKPIGADEKDIINSYGMSKEDAINLVKEYYNSDNYEFSAEINSESKYIVIVTNTITESTTKFLVDPTVPDKSFSMITG